MFFYEGCGYLKLLPCIFGYLAMNRSPHLSVVAVVSVPAANRFIIVNKRFSLWKWLLVIPDSCRKRPISAGIKTSLMQTEIGVYLVWNLDIAVVTALKFSHCIACNIGKHTCTLKPPDGGVATPLLQKATPHSVVYQIVWFC